MLEGPELEKLVQDMLKRLRGVNAQYIRKIAAQIKKIGELSQSSINMLVEMSEMYANINDITEQLRIATGLNVVALRGVFTRALQETYTDQRFRAYLAANPDALRPQARQRIAKYVQAVYEQTAGTMANLSNTTAVTPMYSQAIDRAVLAASTGVTSYSDVMRQTIRAIGHNGMRVQYASGYRRRLDTAVRQNVIDAIKQINSQASMMIAEEINATAGEEVYDAVEISAHARSAPDHEPVQGRVFMRAEWEKMQVGADFTDINGKHYEGFRRRIGEWNCGHMPEGFSTKWSTPVYTDDQLQAFIDENHKGCTINGKHKTLYEASQMMRGIETQIRREKDAAVAAQAAGDMQLRQDCQRNINALVRKYASIAKASGNAEDRERMTVEGFKPVKTKGAKSNGRLERTAES